MNLECPVLENNLFLAHKPNKNAKAQPIKKFKAKNPATIRNNTKNILNEKYKMYVEQSAQQNGVVKQDRQDTPLTYENFLDILFLFALFEPKKQRKTKLQRKKEIKWARKNKRLQQDAQLEMDAKEYNLHELVTELESEDFGKFLFDAFRLAGMYVWARHTVEDRIEREIREEIELYDRADMYCTDTIVKDMVFARKINQQKTAIKPQEIDLQDLYESMQNNKRAFVNTVNQMKR